MLQAQATRVGARYTRYADDLTFSGGAQAVGLLKLTQRLLERIGLELDPKKTNIFRRGRRQMVTGLMVNEQVSVPRAVRRRLRAAVHQAEQGLSPHWDGVPQDMAALKGRLGFVAMVQPAQAAPLQGRLQVALDAARPATRAAQAAQADQATMRRAAPKAKRARPVPRQGDAE